MVLNLDAGIAKHQLQVGPGSLFCGRIPQQIRGVISHQHFAFIVAVQLSAQPSHGQFALQQFLGTDGAKADDIRKMVDELTCDTVTTAQKH